jgi:predicted O-methyltransferase YrrM
MFHSITAEIKSQMSRLEALDAVDRADGTPRLKRLRQIPPETGQFLSLLAASVPPGDIIEIGTSAGYSTLWLILACQETGRKLTTYEVLPEKVQLARDTFSLAKVEDFVTIVECDARQAISDHKEIAFCFLDAEKDVYAACYEQIVPRLVKGGFLIADNAINFRTALEDMLAAALADGSVDAMIAPIGKGLLICRKI